MVIQNHSNGIQSGKIHCSFRMCKNLCSPPSVIRFFRRKREGELSFISLSFHSCNATICQITLKASAPFAISFFLTRLRLPLQKKRPVLLSSFQTKYLPYQFLFLVHIGLLLPYHQSVISSLVHSPLQSA